MPQAQERQRAVTTHGGNAHAREKHQGQVDQAEGPGQEAMRALRQFQSQQPQVEPLEQQNQDESNEEGHSDPAP